MTQTSVEDRRQLSKDERLKALDEAERSIDRAWGTGRAERSKITRAAQLDAAEAVTMAGVAMEADEEADEAMRISVIAQRSGDAERARKARLHEREARRKANADHRAATRSAKRAYEAIKFSAPNKMGFMRVVQVLFGLHILMVLLSLVLTSRDTVVYDRHNFVTWFTIILEGVAFWLFINRYKAARPFIIAISAVALAANTIFGLATHTLTPFSFVSDLVVYGTLIGYFAFSQRVRSVLVNDFVRDDGELDDVDIRMRRGGWSLVRDLLVYFIVFSVLGHWMEAAMCQLIRLGLVRGEYDPTNTMLWRDWFYPFPMEGAAVVLIAVGLYPLYVTMKKHFRARGKVWLAYVLSFIANALTCSLIEFSMGLIINADHQLWDYTDMPVNIMGQVCLQNALAFGLAASVVTWFIYPQMERTLLRIPQDVLNIASVIIIVIGGILWSLYLVDPPEVAQKIDAGVTNEADDSSKDAFDSIRIAFFALDAALDELERKVPSIEGVDVDAQLQEIANMRACMGAMMRGMGLTPAEETDDAAETAVEDVTQDVEDVTQDVVADVATTDTENTPETPVPEGSQAGAPEAQEVPYADAA